MPPSLKHLFLIPVFLMVVSCDAEKKPEKDDRYSNNNYFSDSSKTESLDTLQNELNRGETELLRKFAVDSVPWQKWDSSILEKARVRQAPIFLYIVSGLSEDSRSIAQEISERKNIRKILMDKSVCAVADIQINPELGILAHHLAIEINQPTAFPTLLWMSHEGSPIAWLPVSRTSGRKLDIVISSSAAMVDDIWTKDSQYAVSNSKMDNERRQKRFDSPIIKVDDQGSRSDSFRVGTRGISALYSEFDRNIDHTGGLLPTSSLELLSLGSIHGSFTPQVRKKCALAVKEVSQQLISGALKDQLDGSYFYARRNAEWSLPIFSKNLESQTSLARLFLNAGTISKNQSLLDEGQQLLGVIEREWLSKPRSFIAPLSNPDREGSFIFEQDTLKKLLTADELKLASLAYSLKKDGNIPSSVDPLGVFFKKNTLRRNLPLSELAAKSGLTEENVSRTLEQIRQKLLAHRLEVTEFLSDPLIDAGTLARVVRAQLAGANALGNEEMLASAIKNASLLRKNYSHPSEGLSLFPVESHHRAARSKDYSLSALAALDLYQATLDPEWLQWSISIMDEALLKLSREGFPLLEMPKAEQIIPLSIHNRTMIFSDSSVGTSHHIFHQLANLTGEQRFQHMSDLIAKELEGLSKKSPINHSDFLISCARGDSPIVAVVQGSETLEGKSLLKTLNSPQFLSFINIRGSHEIEGLKKLSSLPPLDGKAAVSLIRREKLLGSAANSVDLGKLLEAKISEKE